MVGVAYIVRSYMRDRPELAKALASFKPFRKTLKSLVGLWRRLALLVAAVHQRIPVQLRLSRGRPERDEVPDRRQFRFLRLAGLSRRDRTLYYYLSILRRAAQRGYPRGASETPYEYETKLGPNVSQVEEELGRVTEVFVVTRYSKHRVERDQEARVRADWKRIRAALRAPRQSGGTDERPD